MNEDYQTKIDGAVDAFATIIGRETDGEYDREGYKQAMIHRALRQINMFSKNNPNLREKYDNDDWVKLKRFVLPRMSQSKDKITLDDFNSFPPGIQYAVLSTYVKRIAAAKLSEIHSERIYSEDKLHELREELKMDSVRDTENEDLQKCIIIIDAIYKNYANLARTPLFFITLFEVVRIIEDQYYEGAPMGEDRFTRFLDMMTQRGADGISILDSILGGTILPEKLAWFDDERNMYKYGMGNIDLKLRFPLPIDMEGKLQYVSDPNESVVELLTKIQEIKDKISNMKLSPALAEMTETMGRLKLDSQQDREPIKLPEPMKIEPIKVGENIAMETKAPEQFNAPRIDVKIALRKIESMHTTGDEQHRRELSEKNKYNFREMIDSYYTDAFNETLELDRLIDKIKLDNGNKVMILMSNFKRDITRTIIPALTNAKTNIVQLIGNNLIFFGIASSHDYFKMIKDAIILANNPNLQPGEVAQIAEQAQNWIKQMKKLLPQEHEGGMKTTRRAKKHHYRTHKKKHNKKTHKKRANDKRRRTMKKRR
jgi:hypothetical protein